MATTTTVSSNYSGKIAGAIIGKKFKEADTLRLNLVSRIENVGFKTNIRKYQGANGVVAYACGFTPAGSITLSEKVIEPFKLKDDFQICKEEFRTTWSEELMGGSASNPNMPSDISEAIISQKLDEHAAYVDAKIWGAETAVDGYSGLLEQWASDATVIDVVGTAITEANIEVELKKALNAVTVNNRRTSLSVVVSPDVFQAYWFYLVSKGIANDGNTEPKQVRFGRYTLTEVNGLPDNTIAIYDPMQVYFATGLMNDFNSIQLVDEDEIGLLTGNVRGKIVYSIGVGYANGEEVVLYKTA